MSRALRHLIDICRIIMGLAIAMILAPALVGILLQLSSWPTGTLQEHLIDTGKAALLLIFVGIATSFTTTIYIVVPGIILARWTGIMSPLTCIIGGAIASGCIAAAGITGFAAPREIDWRLIGATLCAGSFSALVYWWVAERPLARIRRSEQKADSKPRSSGL